MKAPHGLTSIHASYLRLAKAATRIANYVTRVDVGVIGHWYIVGNLDGLEEHVERLGHSSIGFTLDTYAHVLPAADEQTTHTLARHILEGTTS